MRILVTGAGGFIGSHLVEALILAGHDVTAMARYTNSDTFGWLDETNDACRKVRGDVCDALQMDALIKGVERVYHLAALGSVPYSFEAPHQFLSANVLGTLNVAVACADHGVEMVHTSTSEVYGNHPAPQSESTPLEALSPYAASKIAADHFVQSLCASRELSAVTLRPFNTYGPRQSARAIIPKIIKWCNDKSAKTITLGNLTPMRDLMFVTDTVSAFMAMDPLFGRGETYVASTRKSVSMGTLARTILQECGRSDIEIISEEGRARGAEVWNLNGDYTKLARYGWAPQVPLSEGIRRTVEWFMCRGDNLLPGIV